MLSVNNGSLRFSLAHLQSPAPRTLDQVVERYMGLPMTLFFHVVSAPTCRYERGYGKGRIPGDIATMDAEQRFKNILRTRHLRGNSKSYFVNKHSSALTPQGIDEIKSVSFALASNDDLPAHFDARGSRFGFCFFHDVLQDRGIRPVVYLNEQDPEEIQQSIFNSPYLLESYGRNYDMRWENEWRIRRDLLFSPDDVAFLIVPTERYGAVTEWLESENLEYEYYVLPSCVFEDALSFLRMLPDFVPGWTFGVELFGGMNFYFEEFLEPTLEEEKEMFRVAGRELTALTRATIQEIYEGAFTHRFLNFVGKLSIDLKNSEMFAHLESIRSNAKEPSKSHRDLVFACCEQFFLVQRERITKDW